MWLKSAKNPLGCGHDGLMSSIFKSVSSCAFKNDHKDYKSPNYPDCINSQPRYYTIRYLIRH